MANPCAVPHSPETPPDSPRGRRFERTELARLRAMRSALLPDELPERPALEMASCFLPANGDVGGDFFVVGANGEATVCVIGDVVGRGLEAAMRASYVRTLLASIVRFEPEPARVLTLTNDALMSDPAEGTDFITAVCLTFTPSRYEVTWALAGHPPPLSLDDGRAIGGGGTPGPPLGVGLKLDLATFAADLAPGRGLLLYTDGIVEARRDASFYGEERLANAVASMAGADPAALVEGVRADVERFAGPDFRDDVCMLALRARATVAGGDCEEVCSPDLITGSAASARG
jgi:serine phosphatase RsbU (regulator of sigma subunit)